MRTRGWPSASPAACAARRCRKARRGLHVRARAARRAAGCRARRPRVRARAPGTHADQVLGELLDGAGGLGERLTRARQRGQHQRRSQRAVAGRLVVERDHVAGLLTAKHGPVAAHRFEHVAIPNVCHLNDAAKAGERVMCPPSLKTRLGKSPVRIDRPLAINQSPTGPLRAVPAMAAAAARSAARGSPWLRQRRWRA